jgi:hypothetical protein
MPKTEAELKEAASKLRTDTKLGRAGAAQTAILLTDLVAFVTAGHTTAFDAVLNPAAQNTTTTAPETLASAAPGPQATVGEIPQPAKRRGRKGVQIGSGDSSGSAPSGIKVGGDTAPPVAATVAGEPAKAPVLADTSNKSIPHNVKAGRGVRVGSQVDKVDTGVRVGSLPVNPAGQVTVGGRPRN